MKNIKKKWMTIPLIVDSLFTATACSSDIKFNQEDFDKVLVAKR